MKNMQSNKEKWKAMKLRIRRSIFMTTSMGGLLLLTAFSYGQRLTFSYKNVGLDQVLNHIKKSTGYDFLYNSKLLTNRQKISVNVKDADLGTALKSCLDPYQLTFEIHDKTVLIKPAVRIKGETAQGESARMSDATQGHVQGRILDPDGQPVENVTVRVKGTEVQTKTDAQGNFQINIPAVSNPVLEISSLGFNSVERRVTSGVLNLTLQPSTD